MNEPSILYVDDDPDGCAFMSVWLEQGGNYHVRTVDDAVVAITLIGQEKFDLYLLDYCLPDVTGVELCKIIRLTSPLAPIIFYSALDREIDRMMAAHAGADCFLVKPNELEQLLPTINTFINHAEKFAEKKIEAPPKHPGHARRMKASGII